MWSRLRRVLLSSALLLVCSVSANADTITLNADHFFSGHVVNFVLPEGHTVVGATLSGTYSAFLDFVTSGGRPVGYFIDSTRVIVGTVPAGTDVGSGAFSYTFGASELAQFNDASFIVTICSGGALLCSGDLSLIVRAQLTLVTAPSQAAPVPEPTTMLLLGTGLAGVAAARKRRGARSQPPDGA